MELSGICGMAGVFSAERGGMKTDRTGLKRVKMVKSGTCDGKVNILEERDVAT